MSDSSDPMDCSLPGSSVHRISHAGVLEWGATAFSRGEGRRDKLEIGTDMYALRYIQWITNKDLLYSIGNSTQYSIVTYIKKF